MVGLSIGIFSLILYISTKQIPRWDIYLDLVRAYSPAGMQLGVIKLRPFAPWQILIVVYVFSIYRICCSSSPYTKEQGQRLLVIVGMITIGITHFIYYLGRSAPSNLLHILDPAIVLSLFWIAESVRFHKKGMALLLAMGFALFSSVNIASSFETVENRIANSLLGSILRNSYDWGISENVKGAIQTPLVTQLSNLIAAKQRQGIKNIGLISDGELSVLTAFNTEFNNIATTSLSEQDGFSNKNVQLIVSKIERAAANQPVILFVKKSLPEDDNRVPLFYSQLLNDLSKTMLIIEKLESVGLIDSYEIRKARE